MITEIIREPSNHMVTYSSRIKDQITSCTTLNLFISLQINSL